MEKISLSEKFKLFSDHWSPRIIAECNEQLVKIAKVSGQFVWHDHKDEDELFFVVKGTLFIDLEDKTLELNAGDLTVIPKGVRHRPWTKSKEVRIMLFEPKTTKHTGESVSELTQNSDIYI